MLPFPWLLRRLGIEAPETSWAVPAGCLLLVLLVLLHKGKGGGLSDLFGGTNTTAWIDTQIATFAKDLQTLIAGVKKRAPNARILLLNLPNFAAMPYAAGATLGEKQAEPPQRYLSPMALRLADGDWRGDAAH